MIIDARTFEGFGVWQVPEKAAVECADGSFFSADKHNGIDRPTHWLLQKQEVSDSKRELRNLVRPWMSMIVMYELVHIPECAAHIPSQGHSTKAIAFKRMLLLPGHSAVACIPCVR
jgi:hypothetical protein